MLHLLVIILHSTSLDWDKYQWNRIGDEGAAALTDPRVIKNFKTLKYVSDSWVPLDFY